MATVSLSRCDIGETWQEEDGSITIALYNFLFNLDRQEFEKVALMVRQATDLRSHSPETEEAQELASCDLGHTSFEGEGEFSFSCHHFSFYLNTEEFSEFAQLLERTERLLSGEFPVRRPPPASA